MPYVDWAKGEDLNFLPFETADVTRAPASGVYAILLISATGTQTIKVGFGEIGKLVLVDREDKEILDFRQSGKLQVTWGATSPEMMLGIARHLSDQLNPVLKAGGLYAPPIEVNMPGSDVVLRPRDYRGS